MTPFDAVLGVGLDTVSAGLILFGAAFFLAGTVGLLRFPDVYTRLHAVTKSDNLGLGLVVAGLMVRSDSALAAAKLGMIWCLVVIASAISGQLVARAALAGGVVPIRHR